MTVEHKMTAFRVTNTDLEEITRRAVAAGMTRSEYIRRSALGTLGDTPETRDQISVRLAAVEARLDRIGA